MTGPQQWMSYAQRAVASDPVLSGHFTAPDAVSCWEWTRGRSEGGYGRVRWQGDIWYTHRLAFFLAFQEFPEAVCHGCDNPPCINVEHLRAGTLADNTAEMWAKGRARVQYANALMLDGGLTTVLAELARVGPRHARGRAQRIAAVAERHGVSLRTLYRLLNPSETPQVYRRVAADRQAAA
jgi:DNA-binding phage protein